MEQSEMEQLAALIEAKQHERRVAAAMQHKVHWPRRTLIAVSVLVGCGLVHWVVEDAHLQMFMQSGELALSVICDSVFARVREI